jgi:hypothetical protein
VSKNNAAAGSISRSRQRLGVKDHYLLPLRARMEVALGAEGYAVARAWEREREKFLPGFGIPDLAAAGQTFAIRTSSDSESRVQMN